MKTLCDRKGFHKVPDCADYPRKVPGGKFLAVETLALKIQIIENTFFKASAQVNKFLQKIDSKAGFSRQKSSTG